MQKATALDLLDLYPVLTGEEYSSMLRSNPEAINMNLIIAEIVGGFTMACLMGKGTKYLKALENLIKQQV